MDVLTVAENVVKSHFKADNEHNYDKFFVDNKFTITNFPSLDQHYSDASCLLKSGYSDCQVSFNFCLEKPSWNS